MNIATISQHNTLQLFDFENCGFAAKTFLESALKTPSPTCLPKAAAASLHESSWSCIGPTAQSFSTESSSLCYGDTTWKWKEMQEIPHAVRTSTFAVLKFPTLLLEIKHVLKLHFSD